MNTYKGIPLAKCPHGREMTDAEIRKAESDGVRMLLADGWTLNGNDGDEWKGKQC